MRLVQAAQAFSVNYTAYDQDPGLFIAFSIYNVSTGTAVFVQKNPAAYSNFGVYTTDFTPASAKTYLIIGAVYTDNTYTVVDTTRATSADICQSIQASVNFFGFAYPSIDQNAALHVQASIYNLTTGTPVLLQTAAMNEVTLGVYFGSFSGVAGKTYQIASVVYTDNTFTTPDLNYAPECDGLDAMILLPNLVVSGRANLVGQQLRATLVGQS